MDRRLNKFSMMMTVVVNYPIRAREILEPLLKEDDYLIDGKTSLKEVINQTIKEFSLYNWAEFDRQEQITQMKNSASFLRERGFNVAAGILEWGVAFRTSANRKTRWWL